MKLSSVREVKASLTSSAEGGSRLDIGAITPYGLASRRKADVEKIQPSVAFGVAPGKEGDDYRLAVRVQHPNLLRSSFVQRAVEEAKGEADVRLIGHIVKRSDGLQARQRPLRPGISVGHFRITAGTIGCFVERARKTFILSNNHVLADENAGTRGTPSCSPETSTAGDGPGMLSRDLPRSFDSSRVGRTSWTPPSPRLSRGSDSGSSRSGCATISLRNLSRRRQATGWRR